MDTSASFTVTVAPGAQPVTITPNGGNLPGETQGVAADDQFCVVSGGKGPYTLSVSAGALPPGMALEQSPNSDGSVNVFIVGTPTQSGAFSFVLTATDSTGAVASVSRTAVAKPAA
jgi:hypothetical protein